MSVCFVAAAHSAGVRLVERVDVLMLFSIGTVGETSVTVLALEWSFAIEMEQKVEECVRSSALTPCGFACES